jgi:hypothetical protein
MSRKSTTPEFIQKAIAVHGNKYNYSKVRYVDSHTKVIIICPEHGEFKMKPNGHLSGQGCRDCHLKRRADMNRLSTEEFIARAKAVHGDRYDYSKSVYHHNFENLIITCLIHGDFLQKPTHHLRGQGCRDCSGKKQLTTEEFIARAREVHGDKYDYSMVEYVGMHSEVIIICSKHGDFLQTPHTHLKGAGCGKCVGQGFRYATYEEAKKIIKPFGLKTSVEYRIWWKANEEFCREKGLPCNPDVYYSKNP